MSIILPDRWTKEFLKEYAKDYYFLYGTCVYGSYKEGAAESLMQDFEHCFGVNVKTKLCFSGGNFFIDPEFPVHKGSIDKSIAKVPRDRPVIYWPKIGQGMSGLRHGAPRTYKYLIEGLDKFCINKELL